MPYEPASWKRVFSHPIFEQPLSRGFLGLIFAGVATGFSIALNILLETSVPTLIMGGFGLAGASIFLTKQVLDLKNMGQGHLSYELDRHNSGRIREKRVRDVNMWGSVLALSVGALTGVVATEMFPEIL